MGLGKARWAEADTRFWADVEAIEHESGGLLCFAAKNLKTGELVMRNGEHKCRTASVIKLPILVHVGLSVEEGAFGWEDGLVLEKKEKVPGSGILTQLTDGLQISLWDACVLMTVLSDNTATNMVLEHVGGVMPVNARMRSLGLEVTTCFRKVYAPDIVPNPYGLGVSTPLEMLLLLEKLVKGDVGSSTLSKTLLGVLANQQYREGIPRYLPGEWRYAGKTGAIDEARNDVGVVTDEEGNSYILSVFCQELRQVCWTVDNPGTVAIAKLAKRLLCG